jgi:hypothetical protein
MARPGGSDESWEYSLRKYLLLLATLVTTVTYGAGFNPPGGVWQTADPAAANRIAGDPIIRDTNYARYLAFFYSNATAFASSLVVIVLVLILSVLHDSGARITLAPLLGVLRAVMVLDLLSLMGAYTAGAFRDTLTAVYSLVLSAGVVGYLVAHLVLASRLPAEEDKYKRGKSAPERLRKVLMLLATFAASVTYVAGLSAPGGFWDHPEDGHRPGDAILKGGPHDARLKAFFVCNTTAFVASLLILVMLLEKKLCFSQKVRSYEIYGFVAVTLISLLAAYAAGSSRKIDTTIYVSALVGVVAVCILIQVVFVLLFQQANSSQGQQTNGNGRYWQMIYILLLLLPPLQFCAIASLYRHFKLSMRTNHRFLCNLSVMSVNRLKVRKPAMTTMAGTDGRTYCPLSLYILCKLLELQYANQRHFTCNFLMVFLSLSFISNEQQQQTQGLQTSNDNVRYGTDWKSMSLLFQLSELVKGLFGCKKIW